MPTAFLNATFGTPTIDAENGIISGVKIMELGCTAHFADTTGKKHVVTITSKHIDALMGHAGNRAVPIHETHEWLDSEGKQNADSVELNSRIGVLKGFRKNAQGDLIADAHLKDGPKRQDILWLAKNNPEDTQFSAVYNFKEDDALCLPTNFRAGDIVPQGAATTALFSETKTDTTMPITLDDLKEVCSTPEGKEMLRSAIKGHDNAEAQMEDAAAAEMETDAGVTDADKKPEDAQKPALMRAALRCNRARTRLAKSLSSEQETAILAKVDITAKKAATELLGKGTLHKVTDDGKQNEPATATAKFNAAIRELTEKGVKPGVATQTVLRTHKDVHQAMLKEQGVTK